MPRGSYSPSRRGKPSHKTPQIISHPDPSLLVDSRLGAGSTASVNSTFSAFSDYYHRKKPFPSRGRGLFYTSRPHSSPSTRSQTVLLVCPTNAVNGLHQQNRKASTGYRRIPPRTTDAPCQKSRVPRKLRILDEGTRNGRVTRVPPRTFGYLRVPARDFVDEGHGTPMSASFLARHRREVGQRIYTRQRPVVKRIQQMAKNPGSVGIRPE